MPSEQVGWLLVATRPQRAASQGSRGPKWKAVEVLMGVQRRDQGTRNPALKA